MKRKMLAMFVVAVIATTGAFAQLAVGFSGALYSDTEMSLKNTFDRFNDGDGIFYGPFVEIGFDQLALGISGNFSFYGEEWTTATPGVTVSYDMLDFDISLYIQGHLFKYDNFFDPFVELGAGVIGKDFRNDADDPDSDNPLLSTKYVDLGVGVGFNIGGLGVFWKMLYVFPGDPDKVDLVYYDELGNPQTYSYYLEQYPVKNLKIFLGGKLIFN